jgi:DNA-binding HxlR family transcriptional regulator
MARPKIAPTDMLAINAVLMSARQAIDIICDRWTLVLILAFFMGETRFNGLMARTGMASHLLTSRLQALEETGLISRIPYSIHPSRHEYRLTNMGKELFDVLLQMARWEAKWLEPKIPAFALVHSQCGATLSVEVRCRACGLSTDARQIDTKVSRAQLQKMPDKQVRHRRSTISANAVGTPPQALGQTLEIFGDKWGIEILLCAFFRIHRFGDFRACIGISTNILSDRLERLVEANLLTQGHDRQSQSGYWLTPRGIDVYAIMVTIHEWADKWVRARYRSPVHLIHHACGKAFLPMMTCVACTQPINRADVKMPVAGS